LLNFKSKGINGYPYGHWVWNNIVEIWVTDKNSSSVPTVEEQYLYEKLGVIETDQGKKAFYRNDKRWISVVKGR
jgi:hypothetical protein